ncbi:adenylate/guanylate cyclase domain-containing protein [Desulfococcaceae bacterium HSG8]|nr:adenylate/guanylate cyclase domain-containing protein [Desulfococcaceae bacterium HSG8]
MPDIPMPVSDYIYDLLIKDFSPAFFLLEKNGRLKTWGGKPEVYGITGLKKGDFIEDHLFLLEGFFPTDDERMCLSCVQTESGVSADIHIFPDEQGCWLLLLDATQKEASLTTLQQEVNELSLFRDKHLKALNQYLGQKDAEKLFRLTLQETGESKYISVLFADIRGFTSYTEHINPAEIFQLLDTYMAAIIMPVLDEGGVVDKIVGDSAMAVFGMLPGLLSPSRQSVKAAFRIIESLRSLNRLRQKDGQRIFEVGIGIASGHSALGIIGSWDRRKTLSVIGPSVNLAFRLEKLARPDEVLIDENTFRKIDALQSRFSKTDETRLGVFSCA